MPVCYYCQQPATAILEDSTAPGRHNPFCSPCGVKVSLELMDVGVRVFIYPLCECGKAATHQVMVHHPLTTLELFQCSKHVDKQLQMGIPCSVYPLLKEPKLASSTKAVVMVGKVKNVLAYIQDLRRSSPAGTLQEKLDQWQGAELELIDSRLGC